MLLFIYPWARDSYREGVWMADPLVVNDSIVEKNRAKAWRHRAKTFADICLGLFWLSGITLVAVMVYKIWGLVP